jgi:hypothetical protein
MRQHTSAYVSIVARAYVSFVASVVARALSTARYSSARPFPVQQYKY